MKHTHRRGKGRREGQYRGRRVRGATIKYKICYEDILYNREYRQYFIITVN